MSVSLYSIRTLLTESSNTVSYAKEELDQNLSAPKPGADQGGSPETPYGVSEEALPPEASLTQIPDQNCGPDLKIKSNVVAFPTANPPPSQEAPLAKIDDILSMHGVADKNDPNASMDTFAALKPQYDEKQWQKGLVSTWRKALIKGGFPVLSLFAKETKNLKDALVAFPAKDKLAVLEHVIVNWEAFVKFCVKGKYKFSLPAHPTPGAVVHSRVEIGLFWEARDGGPQAQAKAKASMEGVKTAEMAVANLKAKKAAQAAAQPPTQTPAIPQAVAAGAPPAPKGPHFLKFGQKLVENSAKQAELEAKAKAATDAELATKNAPQVAK